MKQLLKINLFFFLSLLIGNVYAQDVTTFNYTGGVQTYTVPAGVTSLQIEVWGAEGGGGFAGLGGRALATVPVTPGATLEVHVGGRPLAQLGPGGYNGGGAVNALPCGGGSDGWPGGGASDVRTSPSLSDRLIVGGGGGGQGWSSGIGGAGGGLTGADGEDSWIDNTNGKGGTQVAGGAGGIYGGGPGSPAPSGTFGVGGDSAPEGTYCTGGGGGGGWYGGGGGYVSAGAGGSSYVDYPGTTDEETEAGVREGNGLVIITVLCNPLTVTVSDYELCEGEELTLDGAAESGEDLDWSDGVVNGEPFVPGETGVITYTASTPDGSDCEFSVDIEVFDAPELVALVDETEVCDGEPVVFISSGDADSYEWDPADITEGEPYYPAVGTTTFTITGTNDDTGCETEVSLEVTVHELPEVEANVDNDAICLGDEITLTGSGAVDYEWDPSATDGVAFAPTDIGIETYTVTGTDANGCIGTDEVEVEVRDQINIIYVTTDEILGDDGEINIAVYGGYPAYSFDWDNDGTGDFDDPEDLTGLPGGTYVVVVEDENGCSGTETIVVDSRLGLEDLNANQIRVYPNPTLNEITIDFEGSFDYEITDTKGAILFSGKAVDKEMISLDNVERGIYFVTIKANGEVRTTKIIKN